MRITNPLFKYRGLQILTNHERKNRSRNTPDCGTMKKTTLQINAFQRVSLLYGGLSTTAHTLRSRYQQW